jgi:ABC-type ATPase involved in cell division
LSGLLELDRVTLRYPRGERGRRERLALQEVSLVVRSGELVGVWGARHSGRSSLARVASGLVPPTEGVVRFDGDDLARRTMLGVRAGIGYCDREFDRVIADTVVEHVAAPLLSTDISNSRAERIAGEMLERVGAAGCSELEPDELDPAETIRVSIARAMVTRPRLLIADEPAAGVRASQERPLLSLLHTLARDDGVAILMTADDAAALAGVDRALSINGGVVRGAAADHADASGAASRVVPLRAPESR